VTVDITKIPINNSKVILKGVTGTGKSDILLERYKYMVEELKVPSNEILIILLNRTQSLKWRTKTVLKKSSFIWRTSYYGFIQSEIEKYFPVITKKCDEILNKNIKPIFLTFESAQFLLSKVIERRRRKEGMFSGVTAYTDRIAIELVANLVRAAISSVPYKEIGDRLYNSLELKDETKRKNFKDTDLVTFDYRKKCLELGILDFGMSIDLYNKYLLKDKWYIEELSKRIKHIIVDNIEECVPSCADLIKMLIPNVETCFFAYNEEGGYGESFGSNISYVKENIIKAFEFEIHEQHKSYICSDEMSDLANLLFNKMSGNIEVSNLEVANKESKKLILERHPPLELRSEMLEKVAYQVVDLIKQGYEKSDIVILSTHADPVTEYVIGRILNQYDIEIKNIARTDRLLDNSFTRGLTTIAKLCHPEYKIIPKRDEVKELISSLLKIDPIRSSILAKEICSLRPFAGFPNIDEIALANRIGYHNIEKYNYIKEWIEEYKNTENKLFIDEFFRKVFLELLISDDISENDIMQAKKLIDSSKSFVEIISKFKRDPSKDFMDMVIKGVKAAESIIELEEKVSQNTITLATPVPYLASAITSKIIIFIGISSDNWAPRNIRELTNIQVLTKTWNTDKVYTEELEENKQLRYLAKITRNIMKRCSEKIITFESLLSANGYENEGVFADFFEH
jgi:hypothetical protein